MARQTSMISENLLFEVLFCFCNTVQFEVCNFCTTNQTDLRFSEHSTCIVQPGLKLTPLVEPMLQCQAELGYLNEQSNDRVTEYTFFRGDPDYKWLT